eukprot:TRINITY_DN62755_c0_g1_i1.p1 TRINITY_DN62755_c0_g1~~TRINITY_DN62755_c0_g1_i1.p1  ORF type:complete len:322 (+),score=18.56 TRINITY_DN62755_c0_g1_i1:106-1071(+)
MCESTVRNLDLLGIAGPMGRITWAEKWTVADLKRAVGRLFGITVCQQVLLVDGVELDDRDALLSRVIPQGVSEVTLVTKSAEQCFLEILEMDDEYERTFEAWMRTSRVFDAAGSPMSEVRKSMADVALAAVSKVITAILAGDEAAPSVVWQSHEWGPCPSSFKNGFDLQSRNACPRVVLPGCCAVRMVLCEHTQQFLMSIHVPYGGDFIEARENGWTVDDIATLSRCFPSAAAVEAVNSAFRRTYNSVGYVSRQIRCVSLCMTEVLFEMTFVALDRAPEQEDAYTGYRPITVASMNNLSAHAREECALRARKSDVNQCLLG